MIVSKEFFKVKVIDFFLMSGLGSYIVSVKITDKNCIPKVGNFLTFKNGDIWQIKGIVIVGINNQSQKSLSKNRKSGIWDVQIKPINSLNDKPSLGEVKLSIKPSYP